MANDDPKPTVELIKARTKIYPYEPGGVGTSIAEFLAGKAKLGRVTRAAGYGIAGVNHAQTRKRVGHVNTPSSVWQAAGPERRSPRRS